MSVRSPRVRRLVAIATTALAVAGLATAAGISAGAAPSAPPVPAPVSSTHWAITKPLCAQPADPAALRCYAMERVPVSGPRPNAYRYTEMAGVARGPAGGYTPGDLTRAYHLNPLLDRHKMTVAVVLWHDDPYARRDLDTFDKHYGYPAETHATFRKVNEHGRKRPLPPTDSDAAAEISLDLQTIRSVCRTCRILLVEAGEPNTAATAVAENTAVRLGARIVNNSYGAREERMSRAIRNAYDHPGHVLVASTGDDGWYGWDVSNVDGEKSESAPSFPASSPDVVSVGGTTLVLGKTGQRKAERVWNLNGADDDAGIASGRPLGASGSGCSRLFAAKPWQRHHHGYRATHCAGHRSSADVSADANPVTGFDIYDHYAGGWITIGGTSLASPLIAGMYALAGGSRGVRYPTSQLYVNANLFPKRRYDVRLGGTGYCGGSTTAKCSAVVQQRYTGSAHSPNNLGRGLLDCSYPRRGRGAVRPPRSGACNAAVGYDGPTGVGAPTSAALFRPTQPRVTVVHPKRKRVGGTAKYVAHLHERLKGLHARSYTWIWGDGRRTVTKHARAHHVFRRPGVYRITVEVTDTQWQLGVAHTHTRVVR